MLRLAQSDRRLRQRHNVIGGVRIRVTPCLGSLIPLFKGSEIVVERSVKVALLYLHSSPPLCGRKFSRFKKFG
jgi:hypothetical protein